MKIRFVVDTDKYAGNFEREMTAHITGLLGDCGVGGEFTEGPIFDENFIDFYSDDNGCYRPCEIFLGEKGENNSVAIFLSRMPTDAEINFMKTRAYEFPDVYLQKSRMKEFLSEKGKMKILGFRLIFEKTCVESRKV